MVNPPWNALEAMKKMKQDEEDRKASGKTPSSAKLVPPEGVHIAYELQDDELRWLRDAYNSMDFLSGHFKSNYHTVRPFRPSHPGISPRSSRMLP